MTTEELVSSTIAAETGKPGPFSWVTSLDEFGLDSLEFVSLVQALEAAFDIKIPDTSVIRMNTVGDIIKIIEEIKSAPHFV